MSLSRRQATPEPILLSLILLIVFGLTALDRGDIGRFLRRRLVEVPARLLSRLSRGQFWGLALVLILGMAAVALFETEGLRLLSMAAPELTVWVMMFDVTVMFDMVVLAVTLRGVSAWRGLARLVEATGRPLVRGLGRIGRHGRSRDRRTRPSRPDAPDLDPDLAFA